MSCEYIEKSKHQQQLLFESEKFASIAGMVDGLSHQIKNRLNNFVLASELLGSGLEDLKTKHAQFIEENSDVGTFVSDVQNLIKSIKENVNKTNSLIKTVLTFSVKSKTPDKFEHFYLKEVIVSSINLVCMKYNISSIPVIVDMDDRDVVYGLRHQI